MAHSFWLAQFCARVMSGHMGSDDFWLSHSGSHLLKRHHSYDCAVCDVYVCARGGAVSMSQRTDEGQRAALCSWFSSSIFPLVLLLGVCSKHLSPLSHLTRPKSHLLQALHPFSSITPRTELCLPLPRTQDPWEQTTRQWGRGAGLPCSMVHGETLVELELVLL